MWYHSGGIGHYKITFPAVAEEDITTANPDDDEVVNMANSPSREFSSSDEESGMDSEESTSDADAADQWIDEEDALQYSAL